MRLYMFLPVLVLALQLGCDIPHPGPTPGPPVPTPAVKSEADYKPVMAWEIAKAKTQDLTPTPSPDNDTVKVGDKCPRCFGTGKIPTDGAVNMDCVQCRADGRVDEGDPILLTAFREFSVVAQDRLTILEQEVHQLYEYIENYWDARMRDKIKPPVVEAPPATPPVFPNHGIVGTLDDANYLEVFNQPGYTVIYATATWCGPCKIVHPIIEKIASEGKLSIYEFDVDASPISHSYFRVNSVPQILLCKDGVIIGRLTGQRSEKEIREWLAQRVT